VAAQIDSSDFRIPPEELQKLYQQYREALQRFLQKRRRGSVEDLVQAVYLEALSTRPREAVQEPLKYLFGIALNVLHSDYRRSQRQRARFVSVDPQDLESIPEGGGAWSTEDDSSTEILQQQMHEALKQLPKPCEVAFTRSRRDGWSYNQIAVELGVTSHAVKKYIVKTLAHLRTHLHASLP